MEFKIEAGGKLDLFTRQEFRDELRAGIAGWQAEVTRGIRWRKFSAKATLGAAGTWTIGGDQANNNSQDTGPSSGFVWAVTRLAVSGTAITRGTDTFGVWIDAVTDSKLVSDGHLRFQTYDVGVLVLTEGEQLVLQGAATAVGGGDIWLSGQAAEVPSHLAWQLI